MIRNCIGFIVILLFLNSCAGTKFIDKRITFNEEREALSLEYLKTRYNIEMDSARIVPSMVVLHWTHIPTMEKTFAAFDPPTLPKHRAAIQSASALNVSSHFLVDRDGTIYRLMPDKYFARHVIGLNHCAIGIENVGGTEELPLTNAQLKANVKIVKYLVKNYPVEYLIGHYEYKDFIGHELWLEVDPGYLTDKVDPGEKFMKDIREKLEKLNLKGSPK